MPQYETDEFAGFPRAALDQPAPLFEARSTQGHIRLADYQGQWVMLFAHPADFTPVCTTEFVAFARAAEDFAALDCALLGLSVDSVYAHLAWLQQIEDDFGVKIPFPLIEDPSLSVSRAYGMVHPGASSTATVRSVFVIDPEGILRALVHYPMAVGRSVAECLRLVAALRETAGAGGVSPEGWRPGDPLVMPAPVTQEEARARGGARWYAGGEG